ncbi:MAG: PP2C family protein-serine/threonine phosphatase [bacterium]
MFKNNFAKFLQKEKLTEEESEKVHLKKDLEMAQKVHEGLLQVEVPECPNLSIAAISKPAAKIGGDFYNFFYKNSVNLNQNEKEKGIIEYVSQHNHEINILIGDVAGHGIASALIMALTSGIFTKNNQNKRSVGHILNKTNTDLKAYISNTEIAYVTSLLAKINIEQKKLTIANAGHCPLILQRGSRIDHICADGIVLGLYENEFYEEVTVDLQAEDRLVFYTDGIIESNNMDKHCFGIERLEQILSDQRGHSTKECLDQICQHVEDFQGPLPIKDDQTLIVIDIH